MTIKKIHHIKRRLVYFMAALSFGLLMTPYSTVLAQTPEEIDELSIYGQFHHYVPGDAPLGGAGCSEPGAVGGPADITVDKGFSLGTDPIERQINLMKALMRDYQLNVAQAAGIVGNFMWESGGEHLPPDVNEGGRSGPPAFRGGYGWAQWTASRQRAFINFATTNGYMASANVNANDAANYAWLKEELNTGYRSTITQLKTKNTPEEAAISFEATFERAGKPLLPERTSRARKAFNAYNASNGGTNLPGGGAGELPAGGGAPNCSPAAGGGGIVGANAFPLTTTKSGIRNRNIFAANTTDIAAHPYTAYDILVAEGTPVRAFLSGRVTHVGQDRCPGRMISVFNQESNVTVSYLHLRMSGNAAVGAQVTAGQEIGFIGAANPNGCGTAHLHIDAASGSSRPGCSRLNCPAANASRFIDIGPQLFQTFQALPD